MRQVLAFFGRVALTLLVWCFWWWVLSLPLSPVMNLSVIAGGTVLAVPVVWLGRKILDRRQTRSGAAWTTTFVHFSLGFTLGASVVRALGTRLAWPDGWTRNPMALAALAFSLSLGIWFRSSLFVLWVVFLFTPALMMFLKVFEERELEIRFGASYLEYKTRTPMLFPRRPRA